MGLHMPQRVRRVALGSSLAIAPFALSGCSSNDILYLQIPSPITTEGHLIHEMWTGSWSALWIVGAIVWAMMGYVSVRYRRRSEADVPVQVRYHLPIEIFYTLVPVMMVIVMFYYTVHTEDRVLGNDESPAQHNILVVGQKWSWTFNYEVNVGEGHKVTPGEGTAFEVGTPAEPPTLYLPVGESVNFELRSPDVIHSFWVPAFLFKLDVFPGRTGHFTVTPTKIGTFMGKCTELCGTYHSRMLFNVKVVSAEEYAAHVKSLADSGNTGLAEGSVFVTQQAGLNETGGQE